ncbi:MAG TPA: hypothetical protein VI029_16910, partial [Mycobacterium sp.]
ISRTFQITSLFPEMSARDNARLSAQARHGRRWQPFGGAAIFEDARSRAEAALEQLGFIGAIAALDNPTSSTRTRELLGWRPEHPTLLADLKAGHYFAPVS